MEAAARHVISEDNIPETCNQIMSSFPFSAVELALSRDEPLALVQLTGAGPCGGSLGSSQGSL